MPNEVEPWLWRKAVAAVRRYYKSFPPVKTGRESIFRGVEQQVYRTGWIMGYRAGRRSSASDRGAE